MKLSLAALARALPLTAVVLVGCTAASVDDPASTQGEDESVGEETGAVAPPIYNPPKSIPPNPDFLMSCSGTAYDNSTTCTNAVLAAIKYARANDGEKLGPMVLPSNWYSLTADEQMFVATNIERVDRGLPPFKGIATALTTAAQTAAADIEDPSIPQGFKFTAWGGNLAIGTGNALEAIYLWMYDDGLNSPNNECTTQEEKYCWDHRDNILYSYQCTSGYECEMGAGNAIVTYAGQKYFDWTELLVGGTTGKVKLSFTWAKELQYF